MGSDGREVSETGHIGGIRERRVWLPALALAHRDNQAGMFPIYAVNPE